MKNVPAWTLWPFISFKSRTEDRVQQRVVAPIAFFGGKNCGGIQEAWNFLPFIFFRILSMIMTLLTRVTGFLYMTSAVEQVIVLPVPGKTGVMAGSPVIVKVASGVRFTCTRQKQLGFAPVEDHEGLLHPQKCCGSGGFGCCCMHTMWQTGDSYHIRSTLEVTA